MKYAIDGQTLTAIADAIRTKTETTGAMTTAQMPGKILEISPEDEPIVLQNKTAVPSEEAQTIYPDEGYDGLSSVEIGAISPTYVGSGVSKKAAETYTPGTTDQTIAAGQYLSGAQTIKGDANLKAANIKSGVSIFGVAGTASSGVTVQRKAGTLTTNTSGTATVNVGFKPDIVLFTDLFFSLPGNFECQVAAVFSEKKNNYSIMVHGVSDSFFDGVIFIPTQTINGFSVDIFTVSSSGAQSAVGNAQFPYVAIKYTA
ncbi:MAG: hypothetical protein IKK00_06895 [Oscillospiraceae bacterium]|nr:hypothetical protein [Oscillospiraceae bacterium]